MDEQLYIGLMSGTSLDGIDAALVKFKENQPQLLHACCVPLDNDLRQEIKLLVNPGDNEINRMMRLDRALGRSFAAACQQLLQQARVNAEQISAIGSHGQTIRHWPRSETPSTLQIADPNTIAEISAITTVADFRRRDIAAGGEGAPLVPAFHQHIFHHTKKNRVILNLGGIANITILPADKNKKVTGFDTGPANTLLNHWIQQQQNQPYDKNGAWAATGTVDKDFLTCLMEDDYFRLPPPKSTGTEYFNPAWLSQKLKAFPFLAAEDVQATLTLFTVMSVQEAITQYAVETDEIIVCGGGVHNTHLMQLFEQHMPQYEIHSSADYDINPDYIEAMAFAWLAKQTLEHQSGNLPDVTGAERAVILGGIYYAG